MAEILRINHVSKRYSNHIALNDVSLSIAEKSVFGLLGPNGAGKTSLIRIINQITDSWRSSTLSGAFKRVKQMGG
jgi:ABC-2 type transport system ATP-binding protein